MFSELWLDHVSAHKSLGPAARAPARTTLELERESRQLPALGQIEESESQHGCKGLPAALLPRRPAGFSPETRVWGKMRGWDKAQEVPPGCFCLLLQPLVGKATLKVKSKLQARGPDEQVERGLGSSLRLRFHKRNDQCSPTVSAALGA